MKLNKIFFFVSALTTLLICVSGLAAAQNLEELLKQGDQYTEEFNNQKALDTYLMADKISPNNWEVYWRISRAYVDIGEHMPHETGEEEDAQLATYEKALNYADNAVKLAPDMAITYVRRAIANGRIALFKGIFSVAGVVDQVRDDCEKAIELGNSGTYVQALAHYILGKTHSKVSEKWAPARAIIGLGWADIEIGIKEMEKAIELYPNFRMFYLDLAKAYIKEDMFDKAREMLNKVIESPAKDEDDDTKLAEAKQLLEEIKDE